MSPGEKENEDRAASEVFLVAERLHRHTALREYITLLPCHKATLLHHHMPTYVPCCHKTSLLQYHTTHRYPAITPPLCYTVTMLPHQRSAPAIIGG